MNKKKRTLLLSVVAIFLSLTVMGTLAYFSDKTEEVTNTFTMGNVSFEKDKNGGLDESLVDEYGRPITINSDGKLVDADGDYVDKKGKPSDTSVPGTQEDLRVTGNEYKLMPGKTYTKDPTLHIKVGSEPAWVYAEVVNGLGSLETTELIKSQMVRLGWVNVEGNIWRYNTKVDARAGARDVPVFESFKIISTATEDDIKEVQKNTITIKGFAIQSADIDVTEADTQAKKVFKP